MRNAAGYSLRPRQPFPRDMHVDDTKICFENPLNERMRTLLRLEFMFAQLAVAVQGDSTWEARYALQTYFELVNVIGRGELKPDLLQELDRHHANLTRLGESPGVDISVLNTTLEEISETRHALNGAKLISREMLGQNEFLTSLRQRAGIPGGTCSFDLPALHYWLEMNPAEQRWEHMREWNRPFQPLVDTVSLLLGMIRESAVFEPETGTKGFFQKTLESGAPVQMTRILLPKSSSVYPELSGGKHRFSVRFMEQPNPDMRAIQAEWDVNFELACCVM